MRSLPSPLFSTVPSFYLPFFLSFHRFGSRRRYNRFPWCSPAFWEKIEPVCKTKKALPASRGRPPFPALCLFLLILPTFYPSRGRDSWEPKRFPCFETTEFRCRWVEKAVVTILIANKSHDFFSKTTRLRHARTHWKIAGIAWQSPLLLSRNIYKRAKLKI